MCRQKTCRSDTEKRRNENNSLYTLFISLLLTGNILFPPSFALLSQAPVQLFLFYVNFLLLWNFCMMTMAKFYKAKYLFFNFFFTFACFPFNKICQVHKVILFHRRSITNFFFLHSYEENLQSVLSSVYVESIISAIQKFLKRKINKEWDDYFLLGIYLKAIWSIFWIENNIFLSLSDVIHNFQF